MPGIERVRMIFANVIVVVSLAEGSLYIKINIDNSELTNELGETSSLTVASERKVAS